MILDTTTRSLEILLGGTVAANQMKVTTDWVDMTSSATTGGTTPSTTNNTSAVTIAAAPAASTVRKVYGVQILNLDTVAQTVTVQLNDNSTIYKKIVISVPVNYTLQYTDTSGWSLVQGQGSSGLSGINAQTGTTYTTVLADANTLITCSNASAITVTVAKNASVAYPLGTPIYFSQKGAGQVTLVGDTGVTLNNASSLKTRAQYSVLCAVQYVTDTWNVFGDMQ
jgi:hypothetical protein